MADPKLLDGAWETCSAPGTGNVSLLGAKTGYLSFSGTGAVNNDKVFYCIRDQSGGNEEWGVGTWVTGPTLQRTAGNVLGGTSGAATLVNFAAGTQDVFCSMMLGAFDQWAHRTNTFANLAALQAGRLLLPSDGFCAYRDDGTKLVPWGPLFPLTDPNLQTWTWIGQNSATLDTTHGGQAISSGGNSSTYKYHIRKKAAPATPYTITAALLISSARKTGFDTAAGILFRESSSGKLHSLRKELFSSNTSPQLLSEKMTLENAFSADYLSVNNAPWHGPLIWMRIADDGANRILSVSANGQTWQVFHTIGRTDFLTADEVGFFLDDFTGAGDMTLLSWKEA